LAGSSCHFFNTGLFSSSQNWYSNLKKRACFVLRITIPLTFAGSSEYFDGALAANNPSIYALQEAHLLWTNRRIDCVVSVGTGFAPTNPLKGDGRIIWNHQVRNLIEETFKTAEFVMLECKRDSIYYQRLNPNVHELLSFDCVDRQSIELLSNTTSTYLASDEIRDVCCQLLAHLLYVSEVVPENLQKPTHIIVRSRVSPFVVPKELSPWTLLCECTTNNNILCKVTMCQNSFNITNNQQNNDQMVAIIYINQLQPKTRFNIALKMNTGRIYSISGGNSFCVDDLFSK
jgi:hypothetical protein